MVKKVTAPPPLEERVFQSPEEIDIAIKKLERRIAQLQELNVQEAVVTKNGADTVARSDVRAAIREIFGPNSTEYREHQYIDIWAGGMGMNMSLGEIISAKSQGVTQTIGILNGLINRLREKREDIS